MAIPQVMRWDHKNAPQIDDMRDWVKVKAWYQAIFVDGYLADDDITPIPALSWECVFDDTIDAESVTLTMDTLGDPNVVNRSRLVLQYQGVVNGGTNFGTPAIFYQHLNTFPIAQFGDNIALTNGLPLLTGTNDDTVGNNCPWVVIGTNRGVYFLSGYNPDIASVSLSNPPFSSLDNYSNWHYFGDFINDGISYGRNNQCCNWGYNAVDNISSNWESFNNISTQANWSIVSGQNKKVGLNQNTLYPGIHVYQDENGVNRGLNFTAVPFDYLPLNNYDIGTYHSMKYPYTDGGLYLTPYDLWIRNNVAIVEKDREEVHIGKLPALFYPLHERPLTNLTNLLEFQGTGLYADSHFIGLGRLDYDEIYINITDHWGI